MPKIPKLPHFVGKPVIGHRREDHSYSGFRGSGEINLHLKHLASNLGIFQEVIGSESDNDLDRTSTAWD